MSSNLSFPLNLAGSGGGGGGGDADTLQTHNAAYFVAASGVDVAAGATASLIPIKDSSNDLYLRGFRTTGASGFVALHERNNNNNYWIHWASAGVWHLDGPSVSDRMSIDNSTGIFTFLGSGTFTKSTLGVTAADGVVVQNTSLATIGAQQMTPRVRFKGSGFGTTGSAAQAVEFSIDALPIQGASAPTANLQIGYAVNGGAFANKLWITSTGSIIPAANFNADLGAASNGQFGTLYVNGIARQGVADNISVNACTFQFGSAFAMSTPAGVPLQLRNSTNAQELDIFNTYTDATTNELGRFGFVSNVLQIGTVKGTVGGTARSLSLITDNTVRFTVNGTTGALSSLYTLSVGNAGVSVGKAISALSISSVTTGANVDTTETDLISRSISANTFVTAEDRLDSEMIVSSITSSSGNTNTIKVYFGGAARVTLPSITADGYIRIRVSLIYKGGGGSGSWWMIVEAIGAGLNYFSGIASFTTVAATSAQTLKVTGRSTDASNAPDVSGTLGNTFKFLPA